MRRRLVSAWISTVISLALVLLLVGVGTLLMTNAKDLGDYFNETMQVSVLLKESVQDWLNANLSDGDNRLRLVSVSVKSDNMTYTTH